MRQIKFNNKKSYDDYSLVIESISIQPPVPKTIKEDVPFMNGSYDFSRINGERYYEERPIEIVFAYKGRNKEHVQDIYSDILQWLYEAPKGNINIDNIVGYHFIGEVNSISSFETFIKTAKLSVLFVCSPFKESDTEYGDDIWDIFNFERDYMEQSVYSVSGTTSIEIYNTGRKIVPEIITNSSITLNNNGVTAIFNSSKTKDYNFKIIPGKNTITATGTGTIEIKFRKEML